MSVYKKKGFFSLIFSFVSTIPIYIVVPSSFEDTRMYDFGKYVYITLHNDPSWAKYFQEFMQFLFILLGVETVYQAILLVRFIRFISIFMLYFFLYLLIFDNLENQINAIKILFLFSLALSFPVEFLLYLFRIRLAFSMMLFIIGIWVKYSLPIKFSTPTHKFSFYYFFDFISLLFIIFSFLMHEMMVIPTLALLIHYILQKFDLLRDNDRISIIFLIVLLTMLILPFLFEKLLPMNIFNYRINYQKRELHFRLYYYIAIFLSLITWVFSKFIAKIDTRIFTEMRRNDILTLIFDRLRNPVSNFVIFVIIILKIPMYLPDLSRLIPITLFLLLLMFSRMKIRLTKTTIPLLVIVSISQISSILMQFWYFSVNYTHLENQLDIFSQFLYPLLIVSLRTEGSFNINNFRNFFINAFKLSIPSNIEFNRLMKLIFVFYLVLTPKFFYTEGDTVLPDDISENEELMDELVIKAIDSFLSLNNLTWDYKTDTVIKLWEIALTNNFGFYNRLIALTGNYIIHPDLNYRFLRNYSKIDVNLYLPYEVNDNSTYWVFHLVNIDYTENLISQLKNLPISINNTINEFLTIYKID